MANEFEILENKNMDYIDYRQTYEPEVVPEMNAIVTGNPNEVALILDYRQGDTDLGAGGTCALTSIANACTLSGMEVTEQDVVQYALDTNLCNNAWWLPMESRGGANDEQIVAILKHYGIESQVFNVWEDGGNFETVAEAIEDGKVVLMGVNAGYLWNEPAYVGFPPCTNHQVTVTGVARNITTGEVMGFYICDSGRGLASDAARYLPVQELSRAYNPNIINATVVVTDDAIRIKK